MRNVFIKALDEVDLADLEPGESVQDNSSSDD